MFHMPHSLCLGIITALWLYGTLKNFDLLYDRYPFFFVIAFCLHQFISTYVKSFHLSSRCLSLDLLTFLLLSGLLSKVFITTLVWSILIHSDLMLKSLQPSPFSIWYQIKSFIQFPRFLFSSDSPTCCSIAGPYMFLKVILSHILI